MSRMPSRTAVVRRVVAAAVERNGSEVSFNKVAAVTLDDYASPTLHIQSAMPSNTPTALPSTPTTRSSRRGSTARHAGLLFLVRDLKTAATVFYVISHGKGARHVGAEGALTGAVRTFASREDREDRDHWCRTGTVSDPTRLGYREAPRQFEALHRCGIATYNRARAHA